MKTTPKSWRLGPFFLPVIMLLHRDHKIVALAENATRKLCEIELDNLGNNILLCTIFSIATLYGDEA